MRDSSEEERFIIDSYDAVIHSAGEDNAKN
jgi:hypothetical protein